MLKPLIVSGHPISFTSGKSQPPKVEVADRRVGWAFEIRLTINADVFLEAGNADIFWRSICPGPKVNLSLLGVEHPLSGLVEGVDHIFHPRRFCLREEMKRTHRIGGGDGDGGDLFFWIE